MSRIDRRARIAQLRHQLIGDSISRKRDLDRLLAEVREDERARTLDSLERVKDRREA